MKPWLRMAIALCIAFTPAGAAAQQAKKETPPTKAQAQKGSGGVQDGIKLHGNWVIEVRNPDGTLVRRSEFKNALVATGQVALADLLGGVPFRDWAVSFNESPVAGQSGVVTPLCEPGGMCMVIIPNGPIANVLIPRDLFGNVIPNPAVGTVLFPTLSVLSVSTLPGAHLVMTGTFTVTAVGGGHVERVVTHLQTGAGVDQVFTVANLSTPVPVAQGQIVQFTYTLRFS